MEIQEIRNLLFLRRRELTDHGRNRSRPGGARGLHHLDDLVRSDHLVQQQTNFLTDKLFVWFNSNRFKTDVRETDETNGQELPFY
jgi:hypothetical protein